MTGYKSQSPFHTSRCKLDSFSPIFKHGTYLHPNVRKGPDLTITQTQNLHVGLCGTGIGGLAAAIACRADARVTVLEATLELGEIGSGIQITPNVSRLLIKWRVAGVIGENLVEFEELNMRRWDGTKVGYTKMVPNVRRDLGYP